MTWRQLPAEIKTIAMGFSVDEWVIWLSKGGDYPERAVCPELRRAQEIIDAMRDAETWGKRYYQKPPAAA